MKPKSKGVASRPKSAPSGDAASPDRGEIGARKLAGLFSSRIAAAVSGADYRNLDYWARIGLVVPEIPANGTGTDRKYSVQDIVVLTAVAATDYCDTAVRRSLVDAIRREPSAKSVAVSTDFATLTVDLAAVRRHVASAVAEASAPETHEHQTEPDVGDRLSGSKGGQS